MSDPQAVAQIMSSGVALMGALVAGLSVYFNYRGRHNPFRQAVYNRQMDAYFDITESMSNLYTAALYVLAANDCWPDEEEARARFRTAVREEHEKFTATVNRSLIVLPSRVKAALDHFNEALLAISEPAGQQRPADRTDSKDGPARPEAGLSQAYQRAVNCIRHHLAVDSLTTGMLNEMGIGSESVALKAFRSGVHPLVPVGRPSN